MPARLRSQFAGTEGDASFRIRRQELGTDVHYRGCGRRNLQIPQEHGRDPLIYQNPAMLGIVDKLDNVEPAVIAFNKVGLRASPQLTDQTPGIDWHESDRSIARYGDRALRRMQYSKNYHIIRES